VNLQTIDSKKKLQLYVSVVVMRRFKYWIKDFFGFSRSQVNGFVVLLVLITLMLFSEPIWHWWISKQPHDLRSDKACLDSLVALWESDKVPEIPDSLNREPSLFYFDPNKTTVESFIALGFSQREATRIIRYREKGGKFRIKSDLLKIYGVDSTFYLRIHAFIALPERAPIQNEHKPSERPILTVKKAFEKFDLNTADTSQLKAIYGIGEKLSLRIVKYRDVLGGFVTTDQLKEVYGLDSIVIDRLIENSIMRTDFQPIKVNINTASEKQLSRHPYLSKVAKAIVAYRFQHGDYKSVEEIRQITNLEERTIEKIVPYLKVTDEP
jgi:competence ComEA-like helix-hairpin-helix protein